MPTPSTIGALLASSRVRLAQAPFDISGREAALLLSELTGMSEALLYARDDRPIAKELVERFESLLARRLNGEPMAYLLGRKEFWGIELCVDGRVLIPRPETEHLVEAVLGLDLPTGARLLEIGTGSGAIAIALASERPSWRLVASDRSLGALEVAQRNHRRDRHRPSHGSIESARLSFVAADLLSGLDIDSFSLIVANLPYIGDRERPELSPEVIDFEPHSALFGGGEDGTEIFRRLFRQLREARSGPEPSRPEAALGKSTRPLRLALEIGAPQAQILVDLAEEFGWHVEALVEDYAGKPRVLILASA